MNKNDVSGAGPVICSVQFGYVTAAVSRRVPGRIQHFLTDPNGKVFDESGCKFDPETGIVVSFKAASPYEAGDETRIGLMGMKVNDSGQSIEVPHWVVSSISSRRINGASKTSPLNGYSVEEASVHLDQMARKLTMNG